MPTICSSCGRTSGKCESCIKVDAVLTPERIADIQEAAEAEWLDAGGGSHQLFMTTFARAISREVVAILARKPFTPTQRRRLWDNSPEHHKDAASIAGFERIVMLTERAHGITAQQDGDSDKPRHVCGAQGFGALGDVCPACEQRNTRKD